MVHKGCAGDQRYDIVEKQRTDCWRDRATNAVGERRLERGVVAGLAPCTGEKVKSLSPEACDRKTDKFGLETGLCRSDKPTIWAADVRWFSFAY